MTFSPKVSVPIITYNQVKFIRQAIESVLMQVTDFDFEILVGDDFSSDGTRDIIQEYADKYPGKVIPVLHEKNLGRNGLFNTLETYRLAKGKYIASMDGDDYWTSPEKLQKQYDFLESHPDFAICYNNALIIYEDGSPSHPLNSPNQPSVSTIDDLIGTDEVWFMATSSVMFRNVIKTYPAWFMESVSGDIPRYVLLAKHGKIGYLQDIMAVYRKNSAGTSFTDKYDDANFINNRIGMYEGINQELEFRYDEVLKKNIARYYKMLLVSKQYRGKYLAGLPIALKYLNWMKPGSDEKREIYKAHIIPPFLMKMYSTFALLRYRLTNK